MCKIEKKCSFRDMIDYNLILVTIIGFDSMNYLKMDMNT
jgi:hypothetical protein